jgi:hypothetical protein
MIQNVIVTRHALDRFKERVGGKLSLEEIINFLKEKVAQTPEIQIYQMLRKKQGIYRWNYYVEIPINGKRFYASIKTDDNDERSKVVLSVITEKQFRSLKGRM